MARAPLAHRWRGIDDDAAATGRMASQPLHAFEMADESAIDVQRAFGRTGFGVELDHRLARGAAFHQRQALRDPFEGGAEGAQQGGGEVAGAPASG
jgi:hypothetical protein